MTRDERIEEFLEGLAALQDQEGFKPAVLLQNVMEVAQQWMKLDSRYGVELNYFYMEFEDGEVDAVWRVWCLNELDDSRGGDNVIGYGEYETLPKAICLALLKASEKLEGSFQ